MMNEKYNSISNSISIIKNKGCISLTVFLNEIRLSSVLIGLAFGQNQINSTEMCKLQDQLYLKIKEVEEKYDLVQKRD